MGEDAVFMTIARLEGRGHVIITDKFFTSPREVVVEVEGCTIPKVLVMEDHE